MPSARHLKHTRSVVLEAYERDDGLWELDAHLTDVKTRDLQLASGVRGAGEPIHEMHLRLTYDDSFEVIDVVAQSTAVPYPGACERITPDYSRLVGLNLLRGFRAAVRERMGQTAGCTHLNELLAVLPTAAVQAFAGTQVAAGERKSRPFQLDQCHALRTDGVTVKTYYPEWYRPAKSGAMAAPAELPQSGAAAGTLSQPKDSQ